MLKGRPIGSLLNIFIILYHPDHRNDSDDCNLVSRIRRMKKYIQLFVLLVLISCFISISCQEKTFVPEKEIAKTLLTQIDSFASVCNRLKTFAESASADQTSLQQTFLQCRLAFKKFEWAAEYFEPLAAKAVNGPPVQEVEIFRTGY